jgi:phosphoribosylformylglycinamidine synthase
MLLVVRPDGVPRVREVAARWGLNATTIGRVTDDGRVRVLDRGAVVADVPATLLTDACPAYDLSAGEPEDLAARRGLDLRQIPDLVPGAGVGSAGEALLRLLASPNVGSRRWVYEQYDHTILTNTVVPPGPSDAAVLRIKGTERGIAVAIDCNSRFCLLDPELGARHAVAEATRNVSCAGGAPLAITNCLNFGNPRKPTGAFQLRRAVAGLAAACSALDVPVVSGNVSLYNETADSPVMPTPTVGAVGVLADARRHATMVWHAGDEVLLLGGSAGGLGAGEFLAVVHGRTAGELPPLDLELERRVQRMVREVIAAGDVRTAHDCALGGLAVALAKMAILSGVGFVASAPLPGGRLDEALFAEGASRVVVACPRGTVATVMGGCAVADVPAVRLGRCGGERFILAGALDLSIGAMRVAFEGALAGEE